MSDVADCLRLTPADGGTDYLRQLGVDEWELSSDPGKFYVDVSVENNPEALLDAQLRDSLRRRQFVHRPYTDHGSDFLDVVDLLHCGHTAVRGRPTTEVVPVTEDGLSPRLQTTQEEVERILLEDIKQLFPRKLDESSSPKKSAFKQVTTSIGSAHAGSGTNRFTPSRERHPNKEKSRDKKTMPASIFTKTKTTTGIAGQAVAPEMSYMAMCCPKGTTWSKKTPQSRRGCMRSKPRRRSGGNDDSTDDSDEHLLIPDIPLQHLFERMTSTEIHCIDVKSTPDGSSNSTRTNTLRVDRTTQTDSSTIHIRSLSNDALTYSCGVILNPDLEWAPADTSEEKNQPNGVVLSGMDSTRHLVEFVCDDVEESLPWEVYHEDTVLQMARAGHVQLLRDLISADATRQSDVCDAEGNTALHLACGNGHIDCVRFLWDMCPHLAARTNHAGLTPCMMTVKKGEIEVLDWIIDNAASEKKGSDGVTWDQGDELPDDVRSLLILAAELGQDGCLRLLLDRCGKDRPAEDFADVDGNTPAHMAARHGHLTCLQTLVEYGASVTNRNRYDITPLQCADSANHRLCIGYLMLVDACIELATQREIAEKYSEHGASVNPEGFPDKVMNARTCCNIKAEIDDSGNYSSVNSEVDIRFRNVTMSRTSHFRLADADNKKCTEVQDAIR